MWARVKGATENALLALPFRAAYMFRPGFILGDDDGTALAAFEESRLGIEPQAVHLFFRPVTAEAVLGKDRTNTGFEEVGFFVCEKRDWSAKEAKGDEDKKTHHDCRFED